MGTPTAGIIRVVQTIWFCISAATSAATATTSGGLG